MGCWCRCHIPSFCVVFLVLIFIIFGLFEFFVMWLVIPRLLRLKWLSICVRKTYGFNAAESLRFQIWNLAHSFWNKPLCKPQLQTAHNNHRRRWSTMAAAIELSMNVAVVTVLSELDGIVTLKEEQTMTVKAFLCERDGSSVLLAGFCNFLKICGPSEASSCC